MNAFTLIIVWCLISTFMGIVIGWIMRGPQEITIHLGPDVDSLPEDLRARLEAHCPAFGRES